MTSRERAHTSRAGTTPMSVFARAFSATAGAIASNPAGLSTRARFVHSFARTVKTAVVVCVVGVGGSCVVPPALGLDVPDGGTNSPPDILSILGDNATAFPLSGTVPEIKGSGSATIKLIDSDLNDTLYVRFFVDWLPDDPTPPRSSCSVTPSLPATAIRSAECDLSGLCQSADIGVTRSLLVEVYDRQPLDSGTPLFRAVPSPGLSSAQAFSLLCQEASS